MRLSKISSVFYFLLFIFYVSAISSCSVNAAKIDDSFKKYFDDNKVDGSFTILNNNGEITIYNMAIDTARFLPASTFKIVNSLIGLETNVITDENMVIKWDGITRWNPDWNKDMSMKEAFKVSCVPYYQEVARRIGKDNMKLWIDSLHYGNMDLSSRIDTFWLDNSLKILLQYNAPLHIRQGCTVTYKVASGKYLLPKKLYAVVNAIISACAVLSVNFSTWL